MTDGGPLTQQEREAALSGLVIAQARVHELMYDISPPLRLPYGSPSREYAVLELVLANGSIGTA